MMKTKQMIFALLVLLFSGAQLFAQAPTMGAISDQTIIVNSGSNYIIIPQIDDNNAGVNQSITFTVTSSNTSVLQIGTVDFDANNTFAIINVTEQGSLGMSTVDVEIDDGDGTDTQSFDVTVGNYSKPGMNFEIHDIIFWQESIPLTGKSIYNEIIPTGEGPYATINWSNVPNTVNSDPSDFFTALYKGFIVPPTTGSYTFYINSQDDRGIWLSDDANINNAVGIAVHSDSHGMIGTTSGTETTSSPIILEAGKVYAIYATQWIVHSTYGGISWSGPGISKSFVDGQYLMYNYDPVFPTTPTNCTLETKGVTTMRVSWAAATDDKVLEGYNIYVNGVKVNGALVEDLVYEVTSLSADTKYSIAVTSVDGMGNESPLSNIVTASTWPTDGGDPTAPTSISTDLATGLALQISWTGASDGETEVIAYNVYVDGGLYNTDDYVYDNEVVIKVLEPETDYDIQVQAVDAAFNTSGLSSVYTASTVAFDALGSDLGVMSATVDIEITNKTWSEGIGVNPSYASGVSSQDLGFMREMEVGAIRWGAITANSLSFSGHSGTGKTTTYAEFINHAIDLDCYAVICCGVQDGIDWRTSSSTFVNFLEYINGPSGTFASRRIAEGYSEPMLQNVKGLIFEFGNEVWGGATHDAEIGEGGYNTYVPWARTMAAAMKNSPYWDEDKIDLVYSGRGPTLHALNTACLEGDEQEIGWLGVSGYLGGNLNYDPEIDPGDSELDYYKNGYQMISNNLSGMLGLQRQSLEETGETKALYFYEGTTSTPAYNGRLGQAIMTMDYFLAGIEHGQAIPSIFHLTGGQWKIINTLDGNKRLPLFITAKFFNRHCKANVMNTEISSNIKPKNSSGVEYDFDPVGVYAYTKDGNYSVVLTSRDFENDFYVELDLPDGLNYNGSAKEYVFSGVDFNTVDATVDSTNITMTDGYLVKVPKYSMVLITFTGDDQNFTPKEPGDLDYVKQTSVAIETGGTTVITGDNPFILLNATTQPTNSFITAVKWEITNSTTNYLNAAAGEGYLIQGTGVCEDNGTVTVKASLLDNPSVYDEVTITISGQGGCGVIENINEKNTGFSVYPNPANTMINVVIPQESAILTISNTQGKQVLSKDINSNKTELNIESLKPGLYYIEVNTNNGREVQKLIKN